LTLYENDVDINLRILLDLYKDEDQAPTFHKRLFFDIEAEMGGALNLAYCQKAPMKITSVALYDDTAKEYYVYVLGEMEDSVNGSTFVYCFPDERDLLNAVLDKWSEIDPTLIITWNGDNFDIPYMYNRMKRLLGEPRANQLSPIGIVTFDEFDKMKAPYKIAGLTSLDYMRLYKKFIPKQQPSYALDAIGKTEVGRGKIVYQGSLDTLFKTDINKFIEYNVNDVSLLVDIDAKRRFIDLAVMVCHMAHVPYHYIYQSSRVVEGGIMTYLKRKNVVSPNKPTTMHPELKKVYGAEEEDDDDKFAGAYVKDPVPGLYGWNGDEDLESLYPSLGILLNLGIETFLFKIHQDDPFDDSWNLVDMLEKDPDEYITITDLEDKSRSIQIGELVDMIRENGVIIAPNGVAFDSSTQSILAEVMDYWFRKRKEFKEIMKDYGKKGDMDNYTLYDQYQQVMKVFLNSIYGSLGLASFRYSDGKDYLASAITAAGRLTIMRSMDYVNQRVHDLYEPDAPEVTDWVVLSDTDSLYVSAEAILRHHGLEQADDQTIIETLRMAFKTLSDDINEWYVSFTKDRFNSTINRLKIKSETIGKRLYVSAKKQYAQYIVDKEGVKPKDPFDFKGLDFMKSSFPPLFQYLYPTADERHPL
jgi:DNA polymerase elongation subunit (family B)